MKSILIIGCGSIGERHLRCFQKTERCTLTACDANPALLTAMQDRYGVPTFASLDDALAGAKFDAAVVCTPAQHHLPMTLKLLRAGLHVFIEKPLAIDTALVPEVRGVIAERPSQFVAVAYVYHCMPWMLGARDFLQTGGLGRVLQASAVSGQHFPTFRPAYREIYYTRHETGGGAIQDALTHLVNATEWLIGPCTRLYCDAAHQALEGVTVEDTVNVSARHGDVLVSFSMNQFQAPNETTLLIGCERGSIKIELHERRWGFLRHGDSTWTWNVTPPLERDDLFIAQAHDFLHGMEGQPTPLATFEEAVQTLKFNQAALRSAASGVAIVIE
jgi:predicted dehydrogenase